MPSNILEMVIDKTQNIPIIVGNTSTFNLSVKNLSNEQRLYNLSLFLTLPDGLFLSSSTISQTTSISNSNNSITYSWINLKDLAPNEANYTFSITVKCNTKFKNGTIIPFGYAFSGINMSCKVDTMPRGFYDIGNEVITQTSTISFNTSRFYSTISTLGKVLKGAGTSMSLNDYTQINTSTCKFYNNSISTSLVDITILLDDGIRYLGSIIPSGTDASQFINPQINTITVNDKSYTQIYYSNINLSINSNTTLTFNYAIWNRYSNNTGNFIVHGTKLNMYINMNSTDTQVISNSSSSTNFSAMDLIITTTTNKSLVDVQNTVSYTYTFKTGQYYSLQNIIINYFLPDGIFYISSSTSPPSATDNSELKGYYITYNFNLALANSTRSVTINARINSYYRYKFDNLGSPLPVVASDSFLANTDVTGTLIGPLYPISDNSNVSSSINVASINKQFIKGYYKDGSPKTINALAPGDFAEYSLNYNASTLKAIQKHVYIDDFFPLSADPIDKLNYNYTGYNPITPPELISPHGVDFSYGDIPGLSSATINFKVPIALLGISGQNVNLMKLKGINTYGYSYSNRSQVTINIGNPYIILTKSISGPNRSSIKANETYTYTVTITNTNNLGTETDAFDFTLNDTLSTWFTINESSIKISGNGSFNLPQIENNNIILYIKKLSPGQSLTLTYDVVISSVISPGISITTTANTTNPYSQVYTEGSSNFQYTNLNKSASITINSANITLLKNNFIDLFKVGSLITYKITVTVPQGTIAYGLYIKDTLPSNGQTYVGPSYKDGILVIPLITANVVTFPLAGTVDARSSEQIIEYIFTAKVSNISKSLNSTTSTQTNTAQCLYQKIENGNYTTINKSLNVTINHPNLLMNLSTTDKSTSISYNQTANINTSSTMQFKLIFQNNSAINLLNGSIEIPIDNKFVFSSIDTNVLCNATYNTLTKKISISVPQLSPLQSGYILFTAIPMSNLKSGATVNTQSTAVSYYNDISSTKIYSDEKSNILTCTLSPGVTLMPNPLNQLDDSTSFIVTPPGNTAVILNFFRNTGGGYDDFTLTIQKVSLAYTLYIDELKITDVPANTVYQATLPQMTNLAPGTYKVIKITALVPPTQSLGVRYDFVITTTSNTSPNPQKTVLNIDPY